MSNFWKESITIHNLAFPRFMAAPMDGITDSPMRNMIRLFSKDELLFTEMRHISCVANEKTGNSVKYNQTEQPLAFQVSANKIDFMQKAVEKIIENKFVMLNLNSGCPAKNVIKSGSGSALMAQPDHLELLMKELQKHLKSAMPFTLKIRAGFKEKNGFEIAQRAQDCGVELLIIHPRTQLGGFSAPLDYEMVKKIKQTLTIPIVFSGDINTFDDAKQVYEKTGVDGFMIGRALWGAPWKLKEITSAITGERFSLSTKEVIEYALRHLALNVNFYGPQGATMFKKQLPQYLKGLPSAATLRRNLLQTQSYQEMKEGLEELL